MSMAAGLMYVAERLTWPDKSPGETDGGIL